MRSYSFLELLRNVAWSFSFPDLLKRAALGVLGWFSGRERRLKAQLLELLRRDHIKGLLLGVGWCYETCQQLNLKDCMLNLHTQHLYRLQKISFWKFRWPEQLEVKAKICFFRSLIVSQLKRQFMVPVGWSRSKSTPPCLYSLDFLAAFEVEPLYAPRAFLNAVLLSCVSMILSGSRIVKEVEWIGGENRSEEHSHWTSKMERRRWFQDGGWKIVTSLIAGRLLWRRLREVVEKKDGWRWDILQRTNVARKERPGGATRSRHTCSWELANKPISHVRSIVKSHLPAHVSRPKEQEES